MVEPVAVNHGVPRFEPWYRSQPKEEAMDWPRQEDIDELEEWLGTLKRQLSISPLATREEYREHMGLPEENEGS